MNSDPQVAVAATEGSGSSAGSVIAEVVAAAVNHSVAAVTGLAGDDFFAGPKDEL